MGLMASQTDTLGGVPAPETSIPRAALTRYLRELPNHVVMRNEEDLFGNVERVDSESDVLWQREEEGPLQSSCATSTDPEH